MAWEFCFLSSKLIKEDFQKLFQLCRSGDALLNTVAFKVCWWYNHIKNPRLIKKFTSFCVVLSSSCKYSSTHTIRTIVTFKTICPFQLFTSFPPPFFFPFISFHNIFRMHVNQYIYYVWMSGLQINGISEETYFR